MKQIFQVTGMSCAACANHVEKAVGKLDGVEAVGVNLMLGSMSVTYNEKAVTDDAIMAAVAAAGYGAQRGSDTERGKAKSQQDRALLAMRRRLIWSVVLLVPLFYLAMGHMLSLPVPSFFFADMRGFYAFVAVQLALLIPILILNRSYFAVGFSRLVQLSPNMDTLVALGAAAGVVYSLLTVFFGKVDIHMPDLYFESAGMILTLVTVGKYLEERSKGQTTAAITSLLALAPESAVIKRGDREVTVRAAESPWTAW